MPETLFLIDEDTVPAQAESHALAPTEEVVTVPETKQTGITTKEPGPVPPANAIPAIPKLSEAEREVAAKNFELIGENRKGLVVLVTLPPTDFQQLPQSVFLRKILAAIGFGPEDVAFVNNVSGSITQFEQLRDTTSTRYILSFASRLGTDYPHEKFTLYNPVHVDGVPVVFSQALAKLDGDQNEKASLWEALKLMFGK